MLPALDLLRSFLERHRIYERDVRHWGPQAEQAFDEVMHGPNTDAAELLRSLRAFLKENDMMAYLKMMAVRLVELHRCVKPTGSLYLHCDSTACHYLKLLLDSIFRPERCQDQIVWKRTSGHSDATKFGRVHDVLLYYVKGEYFTWNPQHQPFDKEYVEQYYRYEDPSGRKFMSGDLSAAGLSGGGYEYDWKGVVRVWRCQVSSNASIWTWDCSPLVLLKCTL